MCWKRRTRTPNAQAAAEGDAAACAFPCRTLSAWPLPKWQTACTVSCVELAAGPAGRQSLENNQRNGAHQQSASAAQTSVTYDETCRETPISCKLLATTEKRTTRAGCGLRPLHSRLCPGRRRAKPAGTTRLPSPFSAANVAQPSGRRDVSACVKVFLAARTGAAVASTHLLLTTSLVSVALVVLSAPGCRVRAETHSTNLPTRADIHMTRAEHVHGSC